MKQLNYFLSLLLVIIVFSSCERDAPPDYQVFYYPPDDLKVLEKHLDIPFQGTYDYDVTLPQHLRGFGVAANFVANHDRATLGRVLFYDKDLSRDRTISCASCHLQEKAFADNEVKSPGIEGRKAQRNSQALGAIVNFAAYYGVNRFGSNAIQFFWDERAATVMDQCKETFANENEMGMTMSQVVSRVKEKEFYPVLFKKAFSNGKISEDNVLDALAEFINSMGTFNSKYDQVRAQENKPMNQPFSGFTAMENLGKELYVNNCASCHGVDFSRPTVLMAHNGLPIMDNDRGKGNVTGMASDEGVFKVPTLRNIALTHPYMHDGRFATLEDVIDHYSFGIENHANLSSNLKDGNQPKRFNFSDEEKGALVAFFETLTDESFISDKKYSDPFIN